MKKSLLHSALFTLAGGGAGWLYYTFFGCRGSCPITSSPVLTVLYMGALGFLLSILVRKE